MKPPAQCTTGQCPQRSHVGSDGDGDGDRGPNESIELVFGVCGGPEAIGETKVVSHTPRFPYVANT